MSNKDKTLTTSKTNKDSTTYMEKSENVVLERRRVGLINELSAHLKFISEFVESTVAYQPIDIRQDQIRNTIKQFEEVQAKIEDLDDREDDCQSQHRIEFNELACNGDDSDVEAAVSSKVLHVRTNKENVLEKSYCHAMLATAIININDASGQPRQCRAILDSGSQISFMTRACAMKLQLKNINASTSIAGIGSTSLKVIRLTPAIVSSCTSEYVTALTFHCINVITSDLPSCKVNIKELDIPNSIRQQLADPQFHKPSSIDCLLGADIFYEIFHGERITISSNLAAHSTTFGWIITGQIYDEPQEVTCTSLVTHEAGCQSAVALHVTKSNSRAIEECYAENHFVSTQVSTEEVPELRPIKLALVITAPTDNEMLSKYSEWLPLVRITSFILRFRNNSLSLKTQQSRQTGPLTIPALLIP
ncbi:hypothetical protein ACI65C_001660 [Semiaphis heraclei]